jgi:nondiscriminating glutamyl-tRNA synthetase
MIARPMHPLDPEHALRVRFAPSAAATLHVGSARTALFNWLLARKTGGRLVVLIDDTAANTGLDGEGLLHDLRWLGLDWDEGPDVGGPSEPYRRSLRRHIYDEHLDRLWRDAPAPGNDRAVFGQDGAVLLAAPARATVEDAIKGAVRLSVDGNVQLRSAGGEYSAHFVAAVDDATMNIDLVLRGDEHLDDTAREVAIARALGYDPPRYAHTGLVVDADHKPATNDGPMTIDALRRQGFLPEAVVEHLALLGWSPPDGRESFTLDELVGLFSLERVGVSPSVFDAARLRAFNARALRTLPRERYHALLVERMQRHRLLEDPVPEPAHRWIESFLDAYGDELHTLGEAIEAVEQLREEAVTIPALELERLRNRQVLFFLDAVAQYVDAQPELRALPLSADIPVIASEFGIAKEDAFGALRMALTGSHDGPPLAQLFPLLGHDRIMIRIGAVSSHILHGRGLEPIKYGPGGVPFETIQSTPPPRTATGADDAGS